MQFCLGIIAVPQYRRCSHIGQVYLYEPLRSPFPEKNPFILLSSPTDYADYPCIDTHSIWSSSLTHAPYFCFITNKKAVVMSPRKGKTVTESKLSIRKEVQKGFTLPCCLHDRQTLAKRQFTNGHQAAVLPGAAGLSDSHKGTGPLQCLSISPCPREGERCVRSRAWARFYCTCEKLLSYLGSVVARFQRELPHHGAGVIVKVICHRFHPGVVCVAGIIHVAPVDLRNTRNLGS